MTEMTGFHKSAEAAGARFVEYEGYWLPTAFGDDIMDEYRACRERVIVIDLSPLRKFEVTGPGAHSLLQATVTRDLTGLADGQVVYTAMCNEEGGMVDDGTVFRFDERRFRWIGYTDDDGPWLERHAQRLGLDVTVEPSTNRVHNIAVQGPASRDTLGGLFSPAAGKPGLGDLTWFRFTEGRLGGESGPAVVLSRTGYSGELGYEIFCHPDDGAAVWEAVWSAGRAHGMSGLGLEALDPLRIEAGLVFKGYEYDAGVQDPFEAGIGFTVPAGKADDYVGKEAIARRRVNPEELLVGLDIDLPEPPAETDVTLGEDGPVVGVVTSPCRSEVLDKTIALARVQVQHAGSGTLLSVGGADATVVAFPFYDPDKRRPRS